MLTAVTFNPVFPRIGYWGVPASAKERLASQNGTAANPRIADEAHFMNFRRPIYYEIICGTSKLEFSCASVQFRKKA